MGNVYRETLEIRACSCDMFGAWRPGAVLETMQETAGAHSALLGLERSVMNSLGLAWILSRVKVEFERVPKMGERVSIETYPTPSRHLFFPRVHIFRDEAGQEIGRANSLWVLLEIESRKITNSPQVQEKMPDNRDMPVAAMPATVRGLEGDVRTEQRIPRYTDLDVNLHVNNTKYLDWCCDALGVEVMSEHCVTAFDVNYDAEIRPGCEVRTELVCRDEAFSFCGFSEDKRRFGISGKLQKRN